MSKFTQTFLNNKNGDPALPVVSPNDNKAKPLAWLQESGPTGCAYL